MTKNMDKTAILERNPKVQQTKAAEYLAFEREMKAQGLTAKPHYRVVSPLGRLDDSRQKTPTLALQSSLRK